MNNWISVKDGFPKTECLIINKNGDVVIGYLFESDESETGYMGENEFCLIYNVTHWMPLPEPPKGE